MIINGKTQIYGIIGYPVAHTFSPKMQNAAFQSLAINGVYLPFEVPPSALQEALRGLRALGIQGINCTIPHKEGVLKYLDEIDSLALKIGAVNTILQQEGRLKGFNTDGEGFVRSLREVNFDCRDKRAVILGSGGSARAIAFTLAQEGAKEITLLSRNLDKGHALISGLTEHYPDKSFSLHSLPLEGIDKLLAATDLLVNTTPVGMIKVRGAAPEESPLTSLDGLPAHALVADIIYSPLKTRLLKMAEKRGLKAVNGIGMLLHQGAIAFELWTGQKAPLEIMREALMEQIRAK